MASRTLCVGLMVCLVLAGFGALAQAPPVNAVSSEQTMFSNLYKSVEEMVIPKYNSNTGSPTQVILFEMPGLVINRDEYDANVWQTGGFNARQPEAVAAGFVNRLPYYTGPTFVDSGSTISDVWSNFMYQYIIPIVDDPIQTARVNAARTSLANGTLQNSYNLASSDYAAAFAQFVSFRSDCLAKQPGGVCSAESVIIRESLKRKWFSLEVARRDIAAAEAKIIALQVQDLKNIFADALYNFASNERVDMGGDGFGNSYYLTYLTPSNFWRWWPTTGNYDYNVYADGSVATISPPAGATIVLNPIYGALSATGNGSYTYRPNAGYTGSDSIGWQTTTLVSGNNVTTTVYKSIQIIGNDVLAADQAFVTVSVSNSFASSSSSSATGTLSSSSSLYFGWGWFSASGYGGSSSSGTTTTSETLSSTSTVQFDLARVAIARPWLDTSLLSFYPVAIRNLVAQGWSDGTVTPAAGALQFKFKLLPTAFLVARNVKISSSFSSNMQSLQTAASSSSGSIQVGFGPWFMGAARSSQSSSSRDYHESSSSAAGLVSIRGPQVIGWVCTPVPPFPTSDEAGVRKWEAQQIARQNAAQNATQLLAQLRLAGA